MKKNFRIVCALALLLLLAACGSQKSDGEKNSYYFVSTPDGQELTLEDKSTVAVINRIVAVATGRKEASVPDDAVQGPVYICYQEKTRLAAQGKDEALEYEEIYRILTYPEAFRITVKYSPDTIKNTQLPEELLAFSFPIDEEDAALLANPESITESLINREE